MKKILATTIGALFSFNVFANACLVNVEFVNPPQVKHETHKLNESISLDMSQQLDVQTFGNIKVATNVTCQKLIGAKYTGSEQEWNNFIGTARKGLLATGHKDLKITVFPNDNELFDGKHQSLEYRFSGERAGNKQLIYNFAVLNKTQNTLYVFAVSGHENAKKEIEEEFSRLKKSVQFPI